MFLWVEKYRPHTIEECVLPDDTKQVFRGFLEQGEIPNLLLSGSAGVGKTTIAKVMLLMGLMRVDSWTLYAIRQRPLLLLFLLHLHQSIRLSLWMKRIIQHQMSNFYYVQRLKSFKRTAGSSSRVIIKIKS